MGDRSEQYGATSPLLDPVTAAMLPAALAVALARIRHSPWLLCLLWSAITVVFGGILTTMQPDAPRLLAALPAVCLLIGGLAHTMLHAAGETGLRDAKPLLAICLSGSLIAAAVINTDTYLGTYPLDASEQPVTLVTDIGRFLSTQSATIPVVLYDQRQFYLAHWTIRLLAPQVSGTTVWDQQGLDSALGAIHGSFLLVAVDPPPGLIAHVGSEFPRGSSYNLAVHTPAAAVVVFTYQGQGLA